jgi:hypothetical protein
VRLNRRFRKARDAILAGFGAEATEHPEDPGAGVFIPTPLQEAILQALNGKALKKEDLADDVKIDPSRLYRPGALQELRKSGKVEHKRGIGYYRPDAPPPNTLELKPSPNGHQDAPKLPPSAPN